MPTNDILDLVAQLATRLERAGVSYCQWKSNHRLASFLQGVGDLDLLVARHDATRFLAVVAELGFIRATPVRSQHQRGIEHFFGYDSASGRIVHLHVYYRLNTGGLLVKDFELPFAQQLLDSSTHTKEMPTPPVELECLVFLLRKLLEAASPLERLLLRRDWGESRREWEWLAGGGDTSMSREALVQAMSTRWIDRLPFAGFSWIGPAMEALDRQDWRTAARLGRQVKRLLAAHRIFAPGPSAQRRIHRFGVRITARVLRRMAKKTPVPTGLVVAVTGCDGSGKSTLVRGLADQLSRHLNVHVVHLGRPHWLHALYHRLRRKPAASRAPADRLGTPDSLLRRVMWLILAWQRLRATQDIHRWSQAGKIVICDRYPSLVPGMDGATCDDRVADRPLHRRLYHWERRLYERTPEADLLIELSAKIEILHARVSARADSRESYDLAFLLKRLEQARTVQSPARKHVTLSADTNATELQRLAMSHIWQALGGRALGGDVGEGGSASQSRASHAIDRRRIGSEATA